MSGQWREEQVDRRVGSLWEARGVQGMWMRLSGGRNAAVRLLAEAVPGWHVQAGMFLSNI